MYLQSFSKSYNSSNFIFINLVDVIITEVYTAKYSKVNGYFYYKIGNNNIKMKIDNGGSGYHYKRYNISKGDTLPKVRVKIYQKYRNNNKDGFVTSDINIEEYLIND
jgi:hypothetical protein